MRDVSFASFVVVSAFALGCSRPELAPPDKTAAPAPNTTAARATAESGVCGKNKDVKTYGEKLHAANVVDVQRVLRAPDEFADKTVLVQGKVRAACTKKGCWMELAETSDRERQGTRVTFKDYGFFVPTKSAGKTACVEGTVSARKISAEEVTHMESEGARFSAKLPDGSAREVRIVATGVEMWEG